MSASRVTAAHQGTCMMPGSPAAPEGRLFCPAHITVAAVVAVTEEESFMAKRRLCVLTSLSHNPVCNQSYSPTPRSEILSSPSWASPQPGHCSLSTARLTSLERLCLRRA